MGYKKSTFWPQSVAPRGPFVVPPPPHSGYKEQRYSVDSSQSIEVNLISLHGKYHFPSDESQSVLKRHNLFPPPRPLIHHTHKSSSPPYAVQPAAIVEPAPALCEGGTCSPRRVSHAARRPSKPSSSAPDDEEVTCRKKTKQTVKLTAKEKRRKAAEADEYEAAFASVQESQSISADFMVRLLGREFPDSSLEKGSDEDEEENREPRQKQKGKCGVIVGAAAARTSRFWIGSGARL